MLPIRTTWAGALASLLALTAARAEEVPVQAEPAPRVRTGWGVQGLPLINYNSDEGLGYGARLLVVDSADGTYRPYRYALGAQFFQTTNGVGLHRLSMDAPRFLDSPWRLGVELGIINDRFSPYYGLGDRAAYDASLTACADRGALQTDPDACPDNAAFRGLRYYSFDQRTLPSVTLNLRRALRGPWQVAAGYRFRYTTVRTRYSAKDLGQAGDSRLEEDVRAGRISGLMAGSDTPATFRTAELTASLLLDLRDNEPAPNKGMFHELAVRGAALPTGSAFAYVGATAHLRFYYPLFTPRLVAAMRVLVDVMQGDVPFLLLTSFGGVEWRETMSGIGGVSTARGILKNRLRGQVKALANGEVRWKFLSVEPWRQQVDFTLLAFLDAGQAWENLGTLEARAPRYSGGGGLRIAWEENFIVRVDYGVSPQDGTSGLYIDFNHLF